MDQNGNGTGRDIIGLSAGARRRLWIQSRGKHLSFKTTRDVSMSSKASDILTVVVLQKEAGIKSCLRTVPLFETLIDLENALFDLH